jgi:hypothetical protein
VFVVLYISLDVSFLTPMDIIAAIVSCIFQNYNREIDKPTTATLQQFGVSASAPFCGTSTAGGMLQGNANVVCVVPWLLWELH